VYRDDRHETETGRSDIRRVTNPPTLYAEHTRSCRPEAYMSFIEQDKVPCIRRCFSWVVRASRIAVALKPMVRPA